MSIMTCDRCDRYIDTDWDVEGVFTSSEFICSFCVEDGDLRCLACEGSGYMDAPLGAAKSVCLECSGEGVTG